MEEITTLEDNANMPLQDGGGEIHINLKHEPLMSKRAKQFREKLCELVTRGDVGDSELLFGNEIIHKMIVDGVENGVGTKVGCIDIIRIDKVMSNNGQLKFTTQFT